jgi:flavin-dependent dehydrogenase
MIFPGVPDEVDATIPISTAAARHWDVVVIGAGPAGAALAIRLARQRRRVLLLDRESMPRGKVCGCCLSAVALEELRALDAVEPAAARSLADAPAIPLATVSIVTGGRTVRLPFRGGAVLSRERLDAVLVRAAIAAGSDWLPGADVAGIECDDSGASLVVRLHGETIRIGAEFAVLSTGLAGSVRVAEGGRRHPLQNAARQSRAVRADSFRASWSGDRSDRGAGAAGVRAKRCLIGLGATLPYHAHPLPPGELSMAVGPMGYCGLVRLEDGRLDVAAAIDRQAVREAAGPADAVLAVLRAAGFPGLSGSVVESIRSAPIRATPFLTRNAPPAAAAGRVLRIGDAAGYVEPFTGEGIGWALVSARVLADAFETEWPGGCRAVGRRYALTHRRHFQFPHARCRGVAAVLRRPTLVSAAMLAARIAPQTAGRIAPWLTGAAGPWRGS